MTFDASFPGRGSFTSDGQHSSNSDNTYTGSGFNRSFYTFDVSSLSGLNITSVELRIGNELAFDLPATVTIYDVSTSRNDLIATYLTNDPAGQAIYADLGSGNQYGSFIVSSNPSVTTTTLSGAAVHDLVNAIPSSYFTVGLSILKPNTAVRFDQNPRVQQLIVTTNDGTVPEPASLAIFGVMGLAACGMRRRCRMLQTA
ncbi:PEP-CTERM sorting domain-containing protein [Novipirellula sp.]|uniref:PEP-CTERM sorting domain-containing protein n=1 Tax=Novipirellula sp. TaxID=2795430 RepID=UPI003565EB50